MSFLAKIIWSAQIVLLPTVSASAHMCVYTYTYLIFWLDVAKWKQTQHPNYIYSSRKMYTNEYSRFYWKQKKRKRYMETKNVTGVSILIMTLLPPIFFKLPLVSLSILLVIFIKNPD